MKHKLKIFGLIGLIGLMTVTRCGEDDPSALKIVGVEVTGTDLATGNTTTVDLNGATSATDVPPDGVMTITFSKAVDPATVSTSSVTLTAGTEAVAITVAVDGSEVTVTPTELLDQGTLHTISVTAVVKADDGGKLTAASRTFTTAGTAPAVVPQADKLVVYLSFNGEVADEMGHEILNDEVTLGTDRFGNVESSGDFNGTTNYVGVEYGDDMSNANTTVSYWIKFPSNADYVAHVGTTSTSVKQYVTFCLGGLAGTFHEWNTFRCCDLDYDIDALKYFTNHINSGNSGVSPAGSHIEMKNEGHSPDGNLVLDLDNTHWLQDLTEAEQWVHITTTWNAASHRKAFFINGVPSTVYEIAPTAEWSLDAATIDVTSIDNDESNSRNLYIGSGLPYWATKTATGITPFRSEVPFAFKGQMDDFRMYSVALTDAEVLALYNAEKP